MRFRLGDVTFDGDRRQLLRGKEPVALSAEARHLLEFLIEKSPRAVSTKELQQVIWSGEPVPEWSLLALVSELRRALADDLDQPRFIRHVHGFGYAFEGESAPAVDEPPAATPRHWLVLDGRELPLEEGENILGRDPGSLCVDDGTVSRRHARITVSGGSAVLEDLGSKNGTWWREDRLEAALPLSDGDDFSVGGVRLVYRGPGSGLEESGSASAPARELEVAVVEPIRAASMPGGGRRREIVHTEVTLDMFLARPADLSLDPVVAPPAPPAAPPVAPPTPVAPLVRNDGDASDDESLAGRFE